MQSSRFWSQRSFSVCCPLYKCHCDCTFSLKSLSTVLTPSSAICPNKQVLSEFSWADHTCRSTVALTLAAVALFLLNESPPLFFCFPTQRMIQQSEYHAAALAHSVRGTSVGRHDIIHLLFTWGVLCIFWVHARQAAAFFAPSTLRAGLGVANDWNLFLSTLFA